MPDDSVGGASFEAAATEYLRMEAPGALRSSTARLLSQHTLLTHNEQGLASWRSDEGDRNLREALSLISAATALREVGSSGWVTGLRRAGDMLEWLTTPPLIQSDQSLPLLAAAVFQLAGYPIIAGNYLTRAYVPSSPFHQVYRAFLRADFPGVFRCLSAAWAKGALLPSTDDSIHTSLSSLTAETIAGATGVLASTLRWGPDPRVPTAIRRLERLSSALLHSQGELDWIIVNLTAALTENYVANAARRCTSTIAEGLSPEGKVALEEYLRLAYVEGRSLLWPSQLRGVDALATNSSFALCTPTGSGKTTIAELALIQSLFRQEADVAGLSLWAPLALYLVPSRALASEAESKLSRILSRVSHNRIVVTGLYGGADWGPTDYWANSDSPTVLICTYEKAEALIRFLGDAFLSRLKLLIIDEAHQVQYDGRDGLTRIGDSRALSLESLLMRLFAKVRKTDCRVVALSAVASGFENALASWVTGNQAGQAHKTDYRSTRQFIGSLECFENGTFKIVYDLMDGARLEFEDATSAESPYVRSPISRHPPCHRDPGPEKGLRPHLLWAALNFAAKDASEARHPVLVSVTQNIEGIAADFLRLLEQDWRTVDLPDYFRDPKESSAEERTLWHRCLLACADYFGEQSTEYRLLQHGIVLHHGKMPGLLARLLVAVIERQLAFVVVATSTLSEGVNLPFETILIPSLRRGQSPITPQEFANLAGRAGRPGSNAEGSMLVLLAKFGEPWRQESANVVYKGLIARFRDSKLGTATQYGANSPLAELINSLYATWRSVSRNDDQSRFLQWLESAIGDKAPTELQPELFALDGVLLASLEDNETTSDETANVMAVEERLTSIWKETYAHYAEMDEAHLQSAFMARGRGIVNVAYPIRSERRRIFVTGLPVRAARDLLDRQTRILDQLKTGWNFASSSGEDRLTFIEKTLETFQGIHGFTFPEKSGNSRVNWREILEWWLRHKDSKHIPGPTKSSLWYDYASKHFLYRGNWLLGSIAALALDEALAGDRQIPALDDWRKTGLPWAAFWLKEMLTWGTVDPVAAFLLSHSGISRTRREAEVTATGYYPAEAQIDTNADAILDPRRIRAWLDQIHEGSTDNEMSVIPSEIGVTLTRQFLRRENSEFRCIPVLSEDKLVWFDVAGFALAESKRPLAWGDDLIDRFDFVLVPGRSKVLTSRYIR